MASPAEALRRRALWENVREVARPLLVYWAFLLVMFAAFAVTAMLEEPTGESVMFLGFFALITVVSVGTGQLMALLRVRDWIVYLYWAFLWTFGIWFGIATTLAAAPVGVFVILWVALSPLFTLGGLWSLRVGRDIFSTWVPLVYTTGTVIIIAESKGKVETWQAGNKWAVWDVFTFSVLALSIVFLLGYLVSRETHRLHLWRRGPAAPLMGTVLESGAARPRLSCLGWALIAMLAMGLSVGTAVLGPYLWRTGVEEGDGGGGGGGEPQTSGQEPRDGQGQPGKSKGKSGKKKQKSQASSAGEQIREEMQERVEQTISLLSTLIMLLLMLATAILVFYRPGKRLLLVRHYRRPLWEQAATARIEQGWRLVEIALADIGVPPRGNEPAESLCARAVPVLDKLSHGSREVHGLAEAARIRDRVAYGLGVSPGDVAVMDRVASWAYDTVWERLGDKGQIKALYRGI